MKEALCKRHACVPLKRHDLEKIVWEKPKMCSSRLCRQIKFLFKAEYKHNIIRVETVKNLRDQKEICIPTI